MIAPCMGSHLCSFFFFSPKFSRSCAHVHVRVFQISFANALLAAAETSMQSNEDNIFTSQKQAQENANSLSCLSQDGIVERVCSFVNILEE